MLHAARTSGPPMGQPDPKRMDDMIWTRRGASCGLSVGQTGGQYVPQPAWRGHDARQSETAADTGGWSSGAPRSTGGLHGPPVGASGSKKQRISGRGGVRLWSHSTAFARNPQRGRTRLSWLAFGSGSCREHPSRPPGPPTVRLARGATAGEAPCAAPRPPQQKKTYAAFSANNTPDRGLLAPTEHRIHVQRVCHGSTDRRLPRVAGRHESNAVQAIDHQCAAALAYETRYAFLSCTGCRGRARSVTARGGRGRPFHKNRRTGSIIGHHGS